MFLAVSLPSIVEFSTNTYSTSTRGKEKPTRKRGSLTSNLWREPGGEAGCWPFPWGGGRVLSRWVLMPVPSQPEGRLPRELLGSQALKRRLLNDLCGLQRPKKNSFLQESGPGCHPEFSTACSVGQDPESRGRGRRHHPVLPG